MVVLAPATVLAVAAVVVTQPPWWRGPTCKAAVQALLRSADGSRIAAEELVFRPELIVRGSTAKAPTPAS